MFNKMCFFVLILVLSGLMLSCSKGKSDGNSINTSAKNISVLAYNQDSQVDRSATSRLKVQISESSKSGSRTVDVYADNVRNITYNYSLLKYDPESEHPIDIKFGDFMHCESAPVLTAAPMHLPGVLPVAQVLVQNPDVKSFSGSGLLFSVKFQAGGFDHSTSAVSFSDKIVQDRKYDLPTTSAMWSSVFRGDGTVNQEIDFADFGAVGAKYSFDLTLTGNEKYEPIDGNNNRKIDFADFGVIGTNYSKKIIGWAFWVSPTLPVNTSAAANGIVTIADSKFKTSNGLRGFKTFAIKITDIPGFTSGSNKYVYVAPVDKSNTPMIDYGNTIDLGGGTNLDPPTAVQATDGAFTDKVVVTWVKSINATGYKIYRDSTTTQITTLGDVNIWDDTTVPDKKTHTYWVKAIQGAEESSLSASDTGYLSVVTTLTAPTNVQATNGTFTNKISVTWAKVGAATGYKIYRDTPDYPLTTLGDVNTWDDTETVTLGNSVHSYWVSAINASTESPLSSPYALGMVKSATGLPYTVLGWNDLGMHCMNQDFSEISILPPFNNVHAMVIDRNGPSIVNNGVNLLYYIPNNTTSITKTNFWDYEVGLGYPALNPNIGLTGVGLSGKMTVTPTGDFAVIGVPVTPLNDQMKLNPYQLVSIFAEGPGGAAMGSTQVVAPVSWEISCNLCHGAFAAADILSKHDALNGTTLSSQKPVSCAKCHLQEPLKGIFPGIGIKSLSAAVHGFHANRMTPALAFTGGNPCYACHPGITTKCMRDIHFTRGLTCTTCHDGGMTSLAAPGRTPWVDEPTCASCHQAKRPNFEFEPAGKLFRDTVGHAGVPCEACHNSTHAILPTVVAADNLQSITYQGQSGPIGKFSCAPCHDDGRSGTIPHVRNPDD